MVLDLASAGFISLTDAQGNPLNRHWRPPGARHDDIAEWIRSGVEEAGGSFSDLAWICVGVGPGSFTGIRIAMAFAQGLAMPRSLPLYGFTSFAPLLLSGTESDSPEEEKFAVLPANSGLFYAAANLEDPGALLDAGALRLRLRGNREPARTVLCVSGLTASLEPILQDFGRVHAVEERWNVPALVKHAKTRDRDASHPYYLQLPAAEAKLAGAA